MRALLASGIAIAVLAVMVLVLLAQYTLTAAVGDAVQDELSPAVEKSASLTLEQANASGDLSDYIMLSRDASLDGFRQSIGKAETMSDELSDAIGESELELVALLTKVRATQRAWVKADANPAISLMEAGKRSRAMKATNSKEAWAAYDAMTLASNEFHQALNATRDEAATIVSAFTRVLGITLLIVGVLVAAGLGAFFLGLQAWVLVPLNRVRRDLQRAARADSHEAPIASAGPPELQAVAVDAEFLRRGLVREIDEARAAREGLAQDAPLVAALEAALAPTTDLELPGIAFAGTTQSAEGVMAGDWWDAVLRPDGSLGFVVADVAGHGAEASVTAIRVRSILRAALASGQAPDEALTMAAASCATDPHFVTAIVIVVDAADDAVQWANAGHHPAIIVTHDKRSLLCEGTGPLLSVLGGEWTSRQHEFGGGDVLVAFTDGLVESHDASGDELESSQVAQIIRGLDAPVRGNPEELVTRLLAQARNRATDWRRDDVTLVAVSRRR